MVAGGKNLKKIVRGKYAKGERKSEENYIKNGGLKIASFLGRKLQKIRGGVRVPPPPAVEPRPPQTFLSVKKFISKEGGGE